jgi:hypothetical protein
MHQERVDWKAAKLVQCVSSDLDNQAVAVGLGRRHKKAGDHVELLDLEPEEHRDVREQPRDEEIDPIVEVARQQAEKFDQVAH